MLCIGLDSFLGFITCIHSEQVMIPGDLDRGLGSDVWIRKAKENSFLERAQGIFLDGKGSASSEGGRVVWGGGGGISMQSHRATSPWCRAKSVLWQTSVEGWLLGLVSTTGNGPFRASVTLQGTTPRDFLKALGTAALAQRCRASRDYLFTLFLEQLQAFCLCLLCTNSSSIHKALNPQRQEETARR